MKRSDSKRPSKKPNPLKPKRDMKEYAKFLAVALILLFVVNNLMGERPHITKMKAQYDAEQAEKEARYQDAMEKLLPPRVVFPEDGTAYFEAPLNEEEVVALEKRPIYEFPVEVVEGVVEGVSEEPVLIEPAAGPLIKIDKIEKQAPQKKAFTGGRPKIAIVIDDVGMNLSQSRAAINLDPHITIAFLPYAETVRELAADAISKGNEIIIHAPMEAMDSDVNLGPMALRASMGAADFHSEFQKISESFEGYTGVNNHMGSKLTQDEAAMRKLMGELKARGLYFLDSKTIHTSVAASMAEQYGVPFAVRDVFLDHEEDSAYVRKALAQTEAVARSSGQAIAIGHPKKNTMVALKAWIPTLEAKGFELVKLGELIDE